MANIFFKNQTAIIGAGFVIVLIVMMLLLLTVFENDEEDQPESDSVLISVIMRDFAFHPDTLRIPVGKRVTLQIANEDTVSHEFLTGRDVNDEVSGFETDLFSGINFNMQKEGSTSHKNESRQEENQANLIELNPGQTGMLTFSLPGSKAGMYRMGCFKRSDDKVHYKMGMKGTVIVTVD